MPAALLLGLSLCDKQDNTYCGILDDIVLLNKGTLLLMERIQSKGANSFL